MSIYFDKRKTSAYREPSTDIEPSNNAYILSWWNSAHDDCLAELISDKQWVWYFGAANAIVEITPSDILESWKREDPLCSQDAWYNVLMHFAVARATRLSLTKTIRTPETKVCLLCHQKFVEDSLPLKCIYQLEINRLDFCLPCLWDTVLQNTGSASMSKRGIVKYLRALTKILGRIPPQGFGEGVRDLHELETQDRLKLLRLMRRKPSTKRVEVVFGSWLNGLIHAGILEDGTRRTSRGIQTVARDGHICLSLGEKTIDEWLYSHGISHEKEPQYPEGNFRGDFQIGQTIVEYFGLTGNPIYDEKSRKKTSICKSYGIPLVAIYPKDLADPRGLDRKLSEFLTGPTKG